MTQAPNKASVPVKERLVAYAKSYTDATKDRPPIMPKGGLGALKTDLTRAERYNDKSTRQTSGLTKDKKG